MFSGLTRTPAGTRMEDTEGSSPQGSEFRRSKRTRRQNKKFSFEVRTVNKRVKRSPLAFSESGEAPSGEIIHSLPWLPLPFYDAEEGIWDEAKDSKFSVMGQDGTTFSMVINAIQNYLSKNLKKPSIDWDQIAKILKVEHKKTISSQMCRALWRLAAYQMNVKGEIVDKKLENRRNLQASNKDDPDSDIEETPVSRSKVGIKAPETTTDADLRETLTKEVLSNFYPNPAYSRFTSEEAFVGTGLPRVSVDQQGLPAYNYKQRDDEDIISAVIEKGCDDWNKIVDSHHLEKLRFLLPKILRKRFIHLVRNVRDKRIRNEGITQKVNEVELLYPKLMAKMIPS
mmetsp:Transcript_7321/g.11125  ORF Transcript_7321/g.11125 Transcript_7321/m.11125 type:complete len:341 (+) Transcript_7321:14-1036(+)